MKIFDRNAVIPKYYENHKRVHAVLAVVFSLIASPVLSIVAFAPTGVNLVMTSISKLGWQNGLLPVVYLWGLYNFALFFYLLKLNMDSSQYSKYSKIFFYGVTAFSCAILLVGISVPFIHDGTPAHEIMRKIHNDFAIVGFVLSVVVLIALAATTFFRNKFQALVMSGMMAFLISTGIFAVVCVNAPESHLFVTAAAQMYIFAMLHVILATNFFLVKFLPNEKFAVAKASPSDKQ